MATIAEQIAAAPGIRAKGGNLQVRVYAGKDPATGKAHFLTETIEGQTKAALERAVRARMRLQDQVGAHRRRVALHTVGTLLDRWFHDTAPDKSPTTLATERTHVKHYLRGVRDVALAELTTTILNEYWTRLRTVGAEGGQKAPRALDRDTVATARRKLHAAVEYGITLGWLTENPVAKSLQPKLNKAKSGRVPSEEATAALIEEFVEVDIDFTTFLRVEAISGARRGEALGLKWSEVDFEQASIRIRRDVVPGYDMATGRERVFVRETTKTDEWRPVGMDATTMAMLKVLREECEARAEACGVRFNARGFVFTDDPTGRQPWRPASVTQRFRRARERLSHRGVELEGVKLKNLRAGVASRMIKAGDDITKVAKRLGNSPRTIHSNYLHLLPSADHDSAERLAAGLGDAGTGNG